MIQYLQPMPALSPGGNLNAYVQAVSAFPLLSQQRERELGEALYYQDDINAARELVLSHLRFVVHHQNGLHERPYSTSVCRVFALASRARAGESTRRGPGRFPGPSP